MALGVKLVEECRAGHRLIDRQMTAHMIVVDMIGMVMGSTETMTRAFA